MKLADNVQSRSLKRKKVTFSSILVRADPYLEEAFFSEIQIMAKLESPNIVTFLDVLESGKNYYIVQELCEGDLEVYMNQFPSKKIPEEKAIQILKEICTGFLTLVSEGIVHR